MTRLAQSAITTTMSSSFEIPRHTDIDLNLGFHLQFHWDPYLQNASQLITSLTAANAVNLGDDTLDDTVGRMVMVMSAGTWFIKNQGKTGFPEFQRAIDQLLTTLETTLTSLDVDQDVSVYIVPLPAVVESKLWPARQSLTRQEIETYNGYLESQVETLRMMAPEYERRLFYVKAAYAMMMEAPDQTDDGLHYGMQVQNAINTVIWNHACNAEIMSQKLPMTSTCANMYPGLTWLQVVTLVVFLVSGPGLLLLSSGTFILMSIPLFHVLYLQLSVGSVSINHWQETSLYWVLPSDSCSWRTALTSFSNTKNNSHGSLSFLTL